MAATEILVRFVAICKYSYRITDWYFQGSVKRLPSNKTVFVGDPDERIFIRRGATHQLSGWEIPVKIQSEDKKIEIRLSGTHERPTMDIIEKTEHVSIGDVKATLNVPIHHGYNLWMVSSEGNYSALIVVEVTKDTATAPGKISTVVAHQGASTYNTVHDGMQDKMVHICPIIPVPWGTGIPKPAKGVESLDASDQVDFSISSGITKPNGLVNPALIPILSPTPPHFESHCARIRITQYRPKNLFIDFDRLIWKAVTDNVRFFDGGGDKKEIRGGEEIKAYGVPTGKAGDNECRIEVRWDEPGHPLLAVYRALVGRPKYLHYRANIIKHKPGFFSFLSKKIPNPTVTFEAVRKRLLYNNVLMWQAGIMLVPDPDSTPYNGAIWKDKGIFEVYTSENQTFNMDPNDHDDDYYPTILNQRADILNICYIHSHRGDNPSGLARDRMLSAAEKTEKDHGSPSTSWVFPTGVYPDATGGNVEMLTLGPNKHPRPEWQKSVAGDGQIDWEKKVCGLAIADWAAVNLYKISQPSMNTEAHEIGHVLGLQHRGSGGYKVRDFKHMGPSVDRVNHMAGVNKGKGHPWFENIMSYGNSNEAQDFDIIQTMVMRRHPLLKDAPFVK
jgi:hypothetical protein